ncbi:MAG: site-specific integrase [Nitrospirae bacterium]|nr:site-specific integrase [Nitrospirota bacterium]
MRGHIRKRGKRYAVVIDTEPDEAGKRRQKWFSHRTRKEAETHLTNLLSQLLGGGTIPTHKLKTGEYLDQWLSDYASGSVAITTLKSYKETIKLHLKPCIGNIPLTKLSPQKIQGYYSERLTTGLSPTTVLYHHRVLRQALQHAVRWGLLVRNPCEMVDPPRKNKPEPKIWDEGQVKKFLISAQQSLYYRIYLMAIMTGMRQGEILGLRWQDVDLTRQVARIRQTFYRLGKVQLFKEPKSNKSRRAVPLPQIVVDELLNLREEQNDHRRLFGADYKDHDLIFCQQNGKPVHAHNLATRDFKRVTQGAKLPVIRFHDLRHCHATLLLHQGVHPKIVSERLGHSGIGITMDIYSHALPGLQEAAVKGLEDSLFGDKSANKLQTNQMEINDKSMFDEKGEDEFY